MKSTKYTFDTLTEAEAFVKGVELTLDRFGIGRPSSRIVIVTDSQATTHPVEAKLAEILRDVLPTEEYDGADNLAETLWDAIKDMIAPPQTKRLTPEQEHLAKTWNDIAMRIAMMTPPQIKDMVTPPQIETKTPRDNYNGPQEEIDKMLRIHAGQKAMYLSVEVGEERSLSIALSTEKAFQLIEIMGD